MSARPLDSSAGSFLVPVSLADVTKTDFRFKCQILTWEFQIGVKYQGLGEDQGEKIKSGVRSRSQDPTGAFATV